MYELRPMEKAPSTCFQFGGAGGLQIAKSRSDVGTNYIYIYMLGALRYSRRKIYIYIYMCAYTN